MNLFIIVIEFYLFLRSINSNELIVNTTYGLLSGREFKSRNNRTVAAFNGIPFAKPPLGELRFQVRKILLFGFYFILATDFCFVFNENFSQNTWQKLLRIGSISFS